jgi:hypothetical protein
VCVVRGELDGGRSITARLRAAHHRARTIRRRQTWAMAR